MGKRMICLDIGGTKVLGAVFDENNNILYRIKKKTKADKGYEKVEETIIKVVEELIKEAGMNISDISALGAGAPGVINEDTGEIIYAPNIPWKNYNIKKIIEDKFGVPFAIANDVNAGTLGEWKYGAGVGKKNIVGLFVGTGVGGGLVINNRLYTGSKHAAAEIGHMVLNTEGPYCNCGQRGCLEAYSSKIAMMREIRIQIARGSKTILKDLLGEETAVLKSKILKKAIDAKDELAVEVLDRAVYYMAAASGSLVNIFNPDMIILGGGVIEALGEYILPIFKGYVKRFAWPQAFEGMEIVQSKLGDDAVMYGALAMVNRLDR
ncbi:MAG: ROK family protein [Clostridia bacterium]|nr:ROK family protein [Clostridia bacterium]